MLQDTPLRSASVMVLNGPIPQTLALSLALSAGSGWWTTAALLAVLSVVGCGPRFSPPTVSQAELDAARLAVVEGAPVNSGMRSAEEATVMLTSVSGRLAVASQPLCTTYL